MSVRKDKFRFEEITHQWLDLAERRLAYYQELYLNGRWKQYYQSPELFVARMRDVMKAANAFRKVAGKPEDLSLFKATASQNLADPDASHPPS